MKYNVLTILADYRNVEDHGRLPQIRDCFTLFPYPETLVILYLVPNFLSRCGNVKS